MNAAVIIPRAVSAEHAHESRSHRYAFIPTADVLVGLQAEGFEVVKATTQRVRDQSKLGFERHQLRLRPIGATALRPEVGSVFPEIILTNSHDGSSGFRLDAGLFRLVCSNGLTVAQGETAAVSVPHRGTAANIQSRVLEGVFSVLDVANRAVDAARDWSQIELHASEQEAFAQAAMIARWGVDEQGNSLSPTSPTAALTARRFEDRAPTLWSTFNRLQENLVQRGGVQGFNAAGRRRRVSAVTGIDAGSNLNRALWLIGQTVFERKVAA